MDIKPTDTEGPVCVEQHRTNIVFYCSQCKIYICEQCMTNSHRTHFDACKSLSSLQDVDINSYRALRNKLSLLGLEDRIQTADFIGQPLSLSSQEKLNFYNDNTQLLNNFNVIATAVNSTDLEQVLGGCEKVRILLSILSVMRTPQEQMDIAAHIMRLFDLLINSSIIHRIIGLLAVDNQPHIQWEATKIVTYFSPGPRMASIPEHSELHPSKLVCKMIMGNNGVIQKLLSFISSPCVEVREQSTLALGFFAMHDQEPRDLVLALSGVSILLEQIRETQTDSMLLRITWTLSILAGCTHPPGTGGLKDHQLVLNALEKLCTLLFWKEDEGILGNILITLSYLLPQVEIVQNNQLIWEGLIRLLAHASTHVKRAALFTLLNVVSNSHLQTQFLIEKGMMPGLSELVLNTNADIRYAVVAILSKLATDGFFWNIIESNMLNLLGRLIYDDAALRMDVIKIIKTMTRGPQQAITGMIEHNLVKAIFSNLSGFKEYDPLLADVFGHLGPIYNMEYLYDCLETLNNILTSDSAQNFVGVQGCFDRDCLNKIELLIDSVAIDLKSNTFPLKNINHQNLNKFIENILGFYTKQNNMPLVQYCNILIQNADKSIGEGILFAERNIQVSILPQEIEVKCFSGINFPNGDNRVFFVMPSITLLELIMNIEEKYRLNPLTLKYEDEVNELITIDSNQVLQKAIDLAYKSAENKTKISLKVMVVQPPNVQQSFLTARFIQNPNATRDIIEPEYSDLSNKRTLLGKLNSITGMNWKEIEKMYYSFVKVANTRTNIPARSKGCVDQNEFWDIIKGTIDNKDLVQELFNALDIQKIGKVDFGDFVCGMSVIKNGSVDEKLKIAFMAYDIDHNGFIDPDELLMLLRSTFEAKGYKLTINELTNYATKIFEGYDTNRDNVLSFDEFKNAVLDNQLLLNPFWTDAAHSQFRSSRGEWWDKKVQFTDQVSCGNCRRVYIPNGYEMNRLCPSCSRIASSPIMAKLRGIHS